MMQVKKHIGSHFELFNTLQPTWLVAAFNQHWTLILVGEQVFFLLGTVNVRDLANSLSVGMDTNILGWTIISAQTFTAIIA